MPTFLITGSNRGIGLELARQAAASGAKVYAACRDPGTADALQKSAAESDGRIEIVALEVTSQKSVTAAQASIGTQNIDVLINNAGVMGGDPQSPARMDLDVLADTINVNLIGALRVTNAFADNVAGAKGKVAVISSMMAQFQFSGTDKAAYCVSKTAVNRMFHLLAQDLKPKGVTVAILSPGWVATDMGGASAPLKASQSAQGLLQQIEGWPLAKSGTFGNYAGNAMEW